MKMADPVTVDDGNGNSNGNGNENGVTSASNGNGENMTLAESSDDSASAAAVESGSAEVRSESIEKVADNADQNNMLEEDPEEETRNTEDSIMETSESKDIEEEKVSVSTSDSDSDTSEVPTKKQKRNSGTSEAIHHQTLKKTMDPFVQKKDCNKLKNKVGKCLECIQGKKGKQAECRFLQFRKLRYTERGSLTVAGFPNSECESDYTDEDLKIWTPSNPPEGMSVELAKFLLKEVGDQFCELVKQEKKTLIQLEDQENKRVIWRRVVENMRELCDVCSTTLFNYHWTCSKCGFVVCVSCFEARKNGSAQKLPLPPPSAINANDYNPKDCYGWLNCRRRVGEHVLEQLMLTQIVTGKLLDDLWTKLHNLRRRLNIPEGCDCEKPVDKTASSNVYVSVTRERSNGVAASKTVDKSDASDDDDDDDGIDADEFLDLMDGGGDDSNMAETDGHNDDDSQNEYSESIEPGSKKTTDDCENEKDANSVSVTGDSSPKANLTESPLPDSKISDGGELKNFKRRDGSSAYSIKVVPKEVMAYGITARLYPDVPHAWLCNGYLLRLLDPLNSGNLKMFQEQWKRGQPVIVSNVGTKLDKDLWGPESFSRDFGQQLSNFINCMTGKVVPKQKMKRFWDGFENMKQRLKDENGEPMLLKLKDWPPGDDFAKVLPDRFKDLMNALPLGEYTHRDGKLNLAARLPNIFCKPDLGPKMYIAYGSGLHLDKGTTNLHLDVSDAVNVMVHVGVVKDEDNTKHNEAVTKAIKESDCDIPTISRGLAKDTKDLPGALWHIWEAKDADKIRDMINKIALERGLKVERHHDAIHDQSWYLDSELRKRLRTEYNVVGYPILQCQGDAVFIPAGAPHQVRNLNNCIKIAEDFVSPENVGHCFYLTEQFRNLTETHTNHEDKLQIKNIVYHTVKDAVAVIDEPLNKEESL